MGGLCSFYEFSAHVFLWSLGLQQAPLFFLLVH